MTSASPCGDFSATGERVELGLLVVVHNDHTAVSICLCLCRCPFEIKSTIPSLKLKIRNSKIRKPQMENWLKEVEFC